nr:hypothetical protein [Tanacetum cinerariifolium]
MSARIAKAVALYPSPFKDTEDESSDSDTKREDSKDEGSCSEEEEEEAAPEGQQQAVLVVDTTADESLGLGYGELRCRELALREGLVRSTFEIGQNIGIDPQSCAPVQTLTSPEWSFGSLSVSPSSLVVPTLITSPVTAPAAIIAVDEDEYLEVGSHLHDHTQRLDALPPALFEGYNQDFRELYTRLREARDEIFSQRYRLRRLEQEQERATVTFGALWRPVLALEAWA